MVERNVFTIYLLPTTPSSQKKGRQERKMKVPKEKKFNRHSKFENVVALKSWPKSFACLLFYLPLQSAVMSLVGVLRWTISVRVFQKFFGPLLIYKINLKDLVETYFSLKVSSHRALTWSDQIFVAFLMILERF